MDTSNHACAPNWHNCQTYGNTAQMDQTYGNAAQMDQVPQRQWLLRKCFNCDKLGQLVAQCRAPKKTQINSVIDEPEEITHVQPLLTPDRILNNALAMFDRLPEHLKDDFVQRYEGKSQNFQDV
jgi:hypothetical protein